VIRSLARVFPSVVLLAVLCLVGVEAYGFAHGHLFGQHIWDADGLKKLIRLLGWFAAVAGSILLVVPWLLAPLIVVVIALLTTFAVGPLPVLAVSFFLLSACALGMRLLGPGAEETAENYLLATLLGTAVYIFLMTLLARVPVHYAASWGALLALPILADLRGCGRRLLYWAALIRRLELRTWAERGSAAMLSLLLVMHWLIVLKPERSADALAMHLAVPADIARHHALTFQPARFVWSVMPMGADWIYSIVYLFGGEPAARLLNFAALLMLVALLHCVLRPFVSRPVAFLLVASFASTPLVQLVTGSLFVENLLAAIILGALAALWRFQASGERRFLFLSAALSGTALSVKLGALGFVAVITPFAIAAIARRWKSLGRRPVLTCLLALALFLVAALPTYGIAWRMTANPIYPFHNSQIHSPLIDPTVDFQDSEFRQPLTWHTLYDLTFHTHSYYESQDGAFGFQYLLLLPVVLFGIALVNRGPAISGAAVAIGAALLVLYFQPNARFCYAALPLLLVPVAALLSWLASHGRAAYNVLAACLVAATGLNLYFLPASGWYQKDFYMRASFSRGARDRYIRESIPVRKVLTDFYATHPAVPIFLAAEDDLADATGPVYLTSWHQFPIQDQLRHATGMQQTLQLLRHWGVQYFVSRKATANDLLEPEALRQVQETCTAVESEFSDFYVSQLDPACDNLDDAALAARQPTQPRVTLPAGNYDDYDPAMWRLGTWNRRSVDGTWGHSLTESAAAGARISFAFEGRALTYMHSKGPDYGLAEISIDATHYPLVDLSSPRIERQVRSLFCCLPGGRHVVTLLVASPRIVDLDAFVVE
jgi:hypothetical protein